VEPGRLLRKTFRNMCWQPCVARANARYRIDGNATISQTASTVLISLWYWAYTRGFYHGQSPTNFFTDNCGGSANISTGCGNITSWPLLAFALRVRNHSRQNVISDVAAELIYGLQLFPARRAYGNDDSGRPSPVWKRSQCVLLNFSLKIH